MKFKKPIVYLFIALFFSGGMLEKELSKLDGYWHHYQYHLSRNAKYTFTHFFYTHFLDGIHTKYLSNRHKSIPFKKRDEDSCQIVYCNKPLRNLTVTVFFIEKENILTQQIYRIPEFDKSLLKPPCA